MEEKKLITGGEFLVKDTDIADVFIPEELDEEDELVLVIRKYDTVFHRFN